MKEIITTVILDRYKINVRAVQTFSWLFLKRFYTYECYVCTCLVLTEVRNVTYYITELCMVLNHVYSGTSSQEQQQVFSVTEPSLQPRFSAFAAVITAQKSFPKVILLIRVGRVYEPLSPHFYTTYSL